LLQIRSLVPRVDWSLAIKVWSQFFHFPHPISTVQISASEVASSVNPCVDKDDANIGIDVTDKYVVHKEENAIHSSDAIKYDLMGAVDVKCTTLSASSLPEDVASLNSFQKLAVGQSHIQKHKNPLLPSYRATCHRTGTQHSFQSPAAAASFGGEINNYFGWNVDLENYDIEAVLCIDGNDIRVGVSLTRESLHRRDIVQFGSTTLRPTIAHGMLRLSNRFIRLIFYILLPA